MRPRNPASDRPILAPEEARRGGIRPGLPAPGQRPEPVRRDQGAPRRGVHDGVPARALLQEARLAAGLKHPAIVTVYDIGDGHDGPVFVVLEYVEGQTLAITAVGAARRSRA